MVRAEGRCGMKLDLYIAQRFFWMFARVFSGFFGIMVAIDVVDQLRRYSDSGISVKGATLLALLNAPNNVYAILPLIMVLTAIALFMGLVKSSELVVVRATGRSGLRFLLSPMVSAFLLGVVSVAVWNPIVAATSKAYDQMSATYSRDGSILSVSAAGLWLRQSAQDGQTVIQAAGANRDGTELRDVTFLIYDADGTLFKRISSPQAILSDGAWILQQAKTWHLHEPNPERDSVVSTDDLRIPTDLTREKIVESFGAPRAVSFWDLPGYIADLEQSGFSTLSYRMWYQLELAAPAFLGAMVLIAAGFTMRHNRSGGSGPLVLMALLCGFLTFFLRNFGRVLGENGQIPVLLAAWAPPAAAILLALGLLLHLEDG